MSRNLSKGIKIIKEFEGFKAEPYLCPANVWTVGYGYTLTHGGRQLKGKADRELAMKVFAERWPKGLTKSEASKLLDEVCSGIEREIEKRLAVKVNDHQFGALLSFAYNFGWPTLVGPNCTLWRLLNSGRPSDEVALQFKRWNKMKVNGESVVAEGLIRRRAAETALFLEPVVAEVAA